MASSEPRNLLGLPADIRLNICHYLFANDRRVTTRAPLPSKVTKVYLSSQVFRCCKAIYAEALPVMFADQGFNIRSSDEIHVLAALSNNQGFNLIQLVGLPTLTTGNMMQVLTEDLFDCLCMMPNLRVVDSVLDFDILYSDTLRGNAVPYEHKCSDVLRQLKDHPWISTFSEPLVLRHANSSLKVNFYAQLLKGPEGLEDETCKGFTFNIIHERCRSRQCQHARFRYNDMEVYFRR